MQQSEQAAARGRRPIHVDRDAGPQRLGARYRRPYGSSQHKLGIALARRLQDIPIGRRVALAFALPIMALFAFAAWALAGYYQTAHDMGKLRDAAQIMPVLSSLANALQDERDASAVEALRQSLPARQEATDRSREALARALAGTDASRLAANLGNRIASAQEMIGRLGNLRRTVATQSSTTLEITTKYTNMILELIGVVEEMQMLGTQVGVARTIAAFTGIMHATESAALERAIGAVGLARGHFDPALLASFIQAIERQRLYLESFWLAATAEQTARLDHIVSGFDATELERIRLIAIESRATGASTDATVAHWLAIIGRKIDLLKSVEDHIATELSTQVATAERSAVDAARRLAVLTLVILLLTTSLAFAIARGIIRPLQRITQAMGKLAASDESVEIDDDRRGDEIGNMARALIVFRENLLKVVQAEARLRNEEILRLHHEALGSISQGVLITDAGRHITYANAAFLRLTGYTEAEVLGRTPAFLCGTECPADDTTEVCKAIGAGLIVDGQVRMVGRDGASFWCDWSVTPVLDDQGYPAHFVDVTRDVTETRRVEQELRIAATAFESLHGMMVTNDKGVILRVNTAFTAMTGYSAAEAVGRTPAILKSGRHDADFYADMWRQLVANGAWVGEVWDKRKDGEIYPKWLTISVVRGTDDRATHYVGAFFDISERKKAEEQIHRLAYYDALTQLPNRRLLQDRLSQAMAVTERSGLHGALLFLDMDNFKNLNDTLGHDKGDALLQQVAERLIGCVRGGDTVSRLGGDEFVIVLKDLSARMEDAAAEAELVGEKVRSELNRPYAVDGHDFHSTPSIGITLFRGHEIAADELLKHADLAMYQAKAAGRNALRFFDPDMQRAVTARAILEEGLRTAIQEGQLILHYQAQVDGSGRLTGAEALVRWQHPERGMVPPAYFIPLAEETGLILPLGYWVLETACRQLAAWAKRPRMADLTLAVNVSARQFHHRDFVGQVLSVLERTGAAPGRLKLELTESLLVDDLEETITKMRALKARGVSFSLDDFGTGYSSLAYLKRLPLEQLKIDRSFVTDLEWDENDASICAATIGLAHSLGLTVVAEGVESEVQRYFLSTVHRCDLLQGYLFGKPLPLGDFEREAGRLVGRLQQTDEGTAGNTGEVPPADKRMPELVQ